MTTTRLPQPLTPGPEARRYAPGSWQIPVIGRHSRRQPPTVVEVALVRGDVVTATCTALPAITAHAVEQPMRPASPRCTSTPAAPAHAVPAAA